MPNSDIFSASSWRLMCHMTFLHLDVNKTDDTHLGVLKFYYLTFSRLFGKEKR